MSAVKAQFTLKNKKSVSANEFPQTSINGKHSLVDLHGIGFRQ